MESLYSPSKIQISIYIVLPYCVIICVLLFMLVVWINFRVGYTNVVFNLGTSYRVSLHLARKNISGARWAYTFYVCENIKNVKDDSGEVSAV